MAAVVSVVAVVSGVVVEKKSVRIKGGSDADDV
jgi:hypothetical protein